ncbi:MAG TPA: dihydropteroate synthase [Candidatus Krumholzibacteria bacterium]|nr:dihydropteroate synthase [Candidatus Krumholzibacteria bacterium]
MGIVNLTPDSFWAGSRPGGIEAAVARALQLADEGADILDLGAESTRPGADEVGPDREQERLLPVLAALRARTGRALSVDTRHAATARLALEAGADIINDVSGAADPDMLALVAERGCGLVLMHMQGTPRTMQHDPRYGDVVAEVTGWLAARARLAEEAGVARERLCLDPGIGFGKTLEHNLALLRGLGAVAGGRPLLVGASRKSFIGALTGAAVADRLPGSLAALAAAFAGGAAVVRVHDVAASVQYLDVLAAVT